MTTQAAECCEAPELVWTVRRDDDHYVDVLLCQGCGHEHKSEPWLIPMVSPDLTQGKCVNCGGTLHIANRREIVRMETVDQTIEPVWACRTCDLTEKDAYVLHRKLARLHPSNDFLEAAIAAAEVGRYVLGLKLATADLRWGGGSAMARAVRLQALEAIGNPLGAINETWRWIRIGAPKEAWGILADLQYQNNDPYAALDALRSGLRVDPTNQGWWTEAAEIYYEVGHLDAAARAAVKGVSNPHLQERCLTILFAVAELSLTKGDLDDAKYIADMCSRLDVQRVSVSLLHARVALSGPDYATAARWLAKAEEQSPGHAEVASLQEALPPEFRSRQGLLASARAGTSKSAAGDDIRKKKRKWSGW